MIAFGYARVSTQDQDLSAQVEASKPPARPKSTVRRSAACAPIAHSLPSSWLASSQAMSFWWPNLIGLAVQP